MSEAIHHDLAALRAGLDAMRASPRDAGTVALVVCRPDVGARRVLERGELDPECGLAGDNWGARGSRHTPDGGAHPDMQLNLMNARVAAAVAGGPDRWPLAGDQLYVDLDLSETNLPPGTRLRVGTAVIEVTAVPHRGCAKFAERFGHDALRFVNAEDLRPLRLRGINARVVAAGVVRAGDAIAKDVG